jgi:chemotaxis protein histidine kinase CheA
MSLCRVVLASGLLVAMAHSAAPSLAQEVAKAPPLGGRGGTPQAGADPAVKLTAAGEALRARYAEELKALQVEIAAALPAIDAQKLAVLESARAAASTATDERTKAQANLGKVREAQALVEHAKGKWIGGAEKGIAQAQAAQKKATTDAERAAAAADLAKWQANKEDGLKALKERQAALEKVKADEAKLRQASQTAEAALAKAQADEAAAAKVILGDAKSVLVDDKLEPKLVKAAVLTEATPLGLAQFAQQGSEQQALVDKLLADPELMKEMLVAGGAAGGRYGHAAQILADIQKASPRAGKGFLYRVAVATGLAHAAPIAQRNSEAETEALASVDPVKRYLHYEKAYLNGELDAAFPKLTTWEYRYVVDSYAPDEMLAWGREMLRNYRPDHVTNADYGWRYSGAVRTDVAYRHSNEYTDSADLGFFQNVCKNGGICGRRAFFGRYIVQAFGLPARPFTQPKHAAIVRWTPAGWVVNLGAGWPSGWFREQTGPEFLLDTQARRLPHEYQRVLRAEWVSTVLGEQKAATKKSTTVGVWKQLADLEKKMIVAAANPKELAALGSDLAEANEPDDKKAAAVEKATVTDADKKIATAASGEITVPAAACGGGNHLVKSYTGGLQMIWGGKPVSCVVEVPQAGTYRLAARVVTVHGDQTLALTLNGGKKPIDVPVPFTVGAWQKTEPVEVTLVQGKNTLTFAKAAQVFALKDFTLTPVK